MRLGFLWFLLDRDPDRVAAEQEARRVERLRIARETGAAHVIAAANPETVSATIRNPDGTETTVETQVYGFVGRPSPYEGADLAPRPTMRQEAFAFGDAPLPAFSTRPPRRTGWERDQW